MMVGKWAPWPFVPYRRPRDLIDFGNLEAFWKIHNNGFLEGWTERRERKVKVKIERREH